MSPPISGPRGLLVTLSHEVLNRRLRLASFPFCLNHALNVRASPSACVHQEEKARSFFHSALIYTCTFMVSVWIKAEFVLLQ